MKNIKRWEDIHTDGINRMRARAHFNSFPTARLLKHRKQFMPITIKN